MKRTISGLLLATAVLYACNKSNDAQDAISLTASATETTVGQTISVTATTSVNTLGWSVNPSSPATQAYGVTTEKTNYFIFAKPGEYVIGVRARNLGLDSIHICNHADSTGHHVPDSIWNHHVDSLWHAGGHHLGGCRRGQDSASIVIKVK